MLFLKCNRVAVGKRLSNRIRCLGESFFKETYTAPEIDLQLPSDLIPLPCDVFGSAQLTLLA